LLRQTTTHTCLHDGKLERDVSDRHHAARMIRDRMRERVAVERGFTLIEVLVVIIMVGILAAIALAILLNQQDKGRDASAKSNVTNLVHEVQACNAGRQDREDFRDCDAPGELTDTGLPLGSDVPNEIASGDCSGPGPADTVTGGAVRVLESGADCFVVLGTSKSGNRFWYVKHNGGGFGRGCSTPGVSGCPTSGSWPD
jgi:prepilin-type N-terminal cleavage/methylation domain-containing protein